MSIGLIALLDDVAGLAKVAAASLDDVAGQAAKAGAKAAGVVIDDAAVTPRYVVGFAAARELPIVGKIAMGSLRNKLLLLLPIALALSLLAPWAITPLLMLGGTYLCYEGAEKIFEVIVPHGPLVHAVGTGSEATDPQGLENEKVSSAIKTDFILSAEIMAITLAAVPAGGFWTQAVVLALVGIGITFVVYGGVALIVKADDAGLALATNGWGHLSRSVGRALVLGMPYLLKFLGAVGTAAMIWVGGGIVVHGLEGYGATWIAEVIHTVAAAIAARVPFAPAASEWAVTALGSGIVGLIIGLALIPFVGKILAPASKLLSRAFQRWAS